MKELQFTRGGARITLEVSRLEQERAAPALLLLHGASGLLAGNRYVRQLAEAFAAQGSATYVVHYFDRTGTRYASDAEIHARYETWLETISDAISFIAQDCGADPQRLALLGYSLGGYLAITQAARDPRVRCVIEIAGGLDATSRGTVQRMPPTLILHGEADRRVPASEARRLEEWLREIGATYEIQMYPGEGHLLSPAAGLDALVRGHAFLEKHLR